MKQTSLISLAVREWVDTLTDAELDRLIANCARFEKLMILFVTDGLEDPRIDRNAVIVGDVTDLVLHVVKYHDVAGWPDGPACRAFTRFLAGKANYN